MDFLHLDPDFHMTSQSLEHETFVFNGGEPHIRIKGTPAEKVTITTRIRSFNDIGLLLLATDALKRMGVKELHLALPYFPAARQDRLMLPGESLSVKVYADLINAQGYAGISIFDPHSDVTVALLNNVRVITNHFFVRDCLGELGTCTLVAPDGGALKKIYKLSSFLGGVSVVECSKSRNTVTGELSGFTVYGENLKGQTCVIVDDICDGGGTFTGLAQELKNKGAGAVYLIVSHGIFSKGLDVFRPDFKGVFSTDSFRNLSHPLLTQKSVAAYFDNLHI